MATQLPLNRYQEFLDNSQNYWLDHTGGNRMDPPAPTYREVNGKQKLGRYVDPFGAMGLMQNINDRWHHWYPEFLVSAAIGPLLTGVGWVFVVLVAPFLLAWYLIKRAWYRRMYDQYYAVLQEIERTGEPVWVAYNKDRLNYIERRPAGVWP